MRVFEYKTKDEPWVEMTEADVREALRIRFGRTNVDWLMQQLVRGNPVTVSPVRQIRSVLRVVETQAHG